MSESLSTTQARLLREYARGQQPSDKGKKRTIHALIAMGFLAPDGYAGYVATEAGSAEIIRIFGSIVQTNTPPSGVEEERS